MEVSGNTARQKSRVAIDLAVAVHAGIAPGYDAAAGWWRVNDFAFYAFQAAAIMICVTAEGSSKRVPSICGEIAALRGLEL
jgi:hypothetical protein